MEEVKREEMMEVWDEIKRAVDEFKITFEKPYKYSIWITNVNLGLIGFYIAFLLQIKDNKPFQDKLHILMTLTILIVPVAIGIFYRFKYEVVEIYYSTKNFFKKLKKFLETVDEKFKEKEHSETIIEDKSEYEKLNVKWEIVEKWSKNPIFLGVIIQFVLFIIGLTKVIIDLLKYILS